MSKFTQDFSHIEFTQDEKAALAQRLQQAAEQEETMTDNTKKKVRNVSRGMVVGLAAAAILTVGALAAVLNPTWGRLFSFQSSEEQELLEKIEKRGMTTEGMEQYMDTFKHGMPPHGGLGIGLERLTMKLIGEDNVRETTLFPRDMSRLEP